MYRLLVWFSSAEMLLSKKSYSRWSMCLKDASTDSHLGKVQKPMDYVKSIGCY